MAIIKTKHQLNVDGRMEALIHILRTLREFCLDTTKNYLPTNIIITSLNDGKHLKNSKHYINQAMDIRSHNFSSFENKMKFRQEFEDALGPKFRVLLEDEGGENEHFHVQVKKGVGFP